MTERTERTERTGRDTVDTSAALRVAVIYSVEFPAWIYTYHRLGCIKKFTPFILIYTGEDKWALFCRLNQLTRVL